jgi:hypothetical protein
MGQSSIGFWYVSIRKVWWWFGELKIKERHYGNMMDARIVKERKGRRGCERICG